ncbi:MAG: efflux RND transporter periplasmic adaptor subunit [Planctomycetes bacterium]|nr:efflux RND transporter periplasmic adaptor subunit [Planctomycetota bacterium]
MTPRGLTRVAGGLLVVGALLAGLIAGNTPRGPLTVSGQLEADEVRVGSRIGGRVRQVHVEEGAAVIASQVLVTLEPFDLEERIAEAQAQLEAARAHSARLEAGARPQEVAQAKALRDEAAARLQDLRRGPRAQEIKAARVGLELAEAERRLAALERERIRALHSSGAAPQDQLDAANTRWEVAEARVQTRQEELALLLEGTRAEQVAQAQARLEQAQAALDLVEAGFPPQDRAQAEWLERAAAARVAALERAREELTVRAPLGGVVDALDLRPGALVPANAPLLSIRDPSRLWVRAYVPAPYLGRVRESGVLEVRVDGFGERAFSGAVEFVSLQAEFTPSNVQSPEERQQQVFRVRLRIDPAGADLRPGMNADVILGPRP